MKTFLILIESLNDLGITFKLSTTIQKGYLISELNYLHEGYPVIVKLITPVGIRSLFVATKLIY